MPEQAEIACDHDYVFLSEGYYDGSRSGGVFDEFYCRRCLDRVAVMREDAQRVHNPDPRWYHRRGQR